jgi:hypothetical protein
MLLLLQEISVLQLPVLLGLPCLQTFSFVLVRIFFRFCLLKSVFVTFVVTGVPLDSCLLIVR